MSKIERGSTNVYADLRVQVRIARKFCWEKKWGTQSKFFERVSAIIP